MPSAKPHQLVVEGHDDKHCVVGLMAAHVEWPDGKENAPVHIEVLGSVREILKDGVISTLLKSPPIKSIGVLIDADENAAGRYERIKVACRGLFESLPDALPTEGLIAQSKSGKRFGVWIMPNNATEGYLELFLKELIPTDQRELWRHAVEAVVGAVEKGAAVGEHQKGKAHLYTWLAWQNPPGRAPGLALLQKSLDPNASGAQPFVVWFKTLYQLKSAELGVQ